MRNALFAILAGIAVVFGAPASFAQDAPDALEVEIVAEASAVGEEAPAVEEEAPAVEVETSVEGVDVSVPATDEEAVDMALLLIEAVQSKAWPLVIGLVLLLLVYLLRETVALDERVGPKAVPWVALCVAVAGTAGAGLVAGLPVVEVVMQGILAGVSAIGGWELLFKHLLGAKTEG